MLNTCDFNLEIVGNHWKNPSREMTCTDLQFRKLTFVSVQKKAGQRIRLEDQLRLLQESRQEIKT